MKNNEPDRGFSPLRSRFRPLGAEYRQVGLAFAIPGMLLAGPLVGYGFGWVADVYLGCPEWARLVGLVLGLISGVRESIVVTKRLTKEQETESSSDE